MLTPAQAALLVSINLTDQLCNERDVARRHQEDVFARITDILRLFDVTTQEASRGGMLPEGSGRLGVAFPVG